MKTLAEVRKAVKAGKFEFAAGIGQNSTYDWDALLNGELQVLEAGKDFACKPQTIRMMAHKQAGKRHKNVQVQAIEGGLVLQASDMSDDQAAKYDRKAAEAKAAKADKADEEAE